MSSTMKSHSILVCPARDISHPFVQHMQPGYAIGLLVAQWTSWLSDQPSQYCSAYVQVTLSLLNSAAFTQHPLQYIIIIVAFYY